MGNGQKKDKLLTLAKKDEDIKAIVLIDSSTRDTVKADEYSDLDVVIATDHTDKWLYGDYPEKLGDVKISFVEPTLGGKNKEEYCMMVLLM